MCSQRISTEKPKKRLQRAEETSTASVVEEDRKHLRIEIIPDALTLPQKADMRKLATHLKRSQKFRSELQHVELQAQETLFFPRYIGIDSASLAGSTPGIDLSVGSSGFLPKKKIIEAINALLSDRSDVVEYEHKEIPVFERELRHYLVDEGIIDGGLNVEFTEAGQTAQINTRYAMLSCGSQHALSTLFDVITKHAGDAYIVPTPTYGIALKFIKSAGGKYKLLPLKAENDFRIDPQSVVDLIHSTNQGFHDIHKELAKYKIAKIKKYIPKDKNSLQIYGLIRRIEEGLDNKNKMNNKLIRELNRLVAVYVVTHLDKKQFKGALSDKAFMVTLIAKLAVPYRNCVRGFLQINPHNPTGVVMTQGEVEALARKLVEFPKLTIIEDIAHKDISLTPAKMGFFSRTRLDDRTVTVASFSKSMALAAKRAGFAIGPHSIINQAAKKIYASQFFPSVDVLRTIKGVITTPKAERDKYLAKCNATYQLRLQLVNACIHGIDSIKTSEVRTRLEAKLVELGLQHESIFKTGIKGLSLLTSPEGCFFALLDLSNFVGLYLGDAQQNNGLDFADLMLYLADVQTVPSEVNGYFDIPSVRIALTQDEIDLTNAMKQIKRALSYLTKEPNPDFVFAKPVSQDVVVNGAPSIAPRK